MEKQTLQKNIFILNEAITQCLFFEKYFRKSDSFTSCADACSEAINQSENLIEKVTPQHYYSHHTLEECADAWSSCAEICKHFDNSVCRACAFLCEKCEEICCIILAESESKYYQSEAV
jgi:hypothetical protein